ncbi:hypothetical protein MGYG_02373 [Nannizzia gypsea CBS 118893]|uniref:Uncharacterized protein n=1 Tax=Arthroderma gypseum (strain ATCC MYA-4604 / CBS 118893) TaxID=535722 RepID=E4UR85_ARTGP|nr:hypothetical protein MGYG_02373 [Nannizzia gypsea CBS 118893]EFQ99360.1 hypothetical protein MGYG_02373 [Nannizzia gypsea CBS 118893]
MRFSFVSLILASAAFVSAAKMGDIIGTVNTDDNCASEGVDLLDSTCTASSKGSINVTADTILCFAYPDSECKTSTTTPDGVYLEKGCNVDEKLSEDDVSLLCYA